MKRFLSCVIFISFLMMLTPSYASNQSFITYFGTINGVYKNIQANTENVSSSLEVGPATSPIYGVAYTFAPLIYTMDIDGVINDADGGITPGYLAWGLYGYNNANNLGFKYQADGDGNVIEAVTTGANPRLQFMSVNVTGVTGTAAAPTEIMTLNDAGNLGIGNTNPQHTLDVTGQANITGNSFLGSGGNVTTINGTLSVSSAAAFNGGVTIPTASSLQLNAVNSLQFCNAGVCEPLEVAQGSDGNYYIQPQ